MRKTPVYQVYKPKQYAGTDRKLAIVIWMMSATAALVVYAATSRLFPLLLVGAATFFVFKWAAHKSNQDIFWFKLYFPYNRFADVYLPLRKPMRSERFTRPYGFGKDSDL